MINLENWSLQNDAGGNQRVMRKYYLNWSGLRALLCRYVEKFIIKKTPTKVRQNFCSRFSISAYLSVLSRALKLYHTFGGACKAWLRLSEPYTPSKHIDHVLLAL